MAIKFSKKAFKLYNDIFRDISNVVADNNKNIF